MKKITLFLVAMMMSLLSFAAQPKRIYAYDLSSTLVDKVYTFSFTANETPTSGKIIFYDATSSELVGEIALTNPVLGKNEVEIAEYSLPGNDGQQLNWAVELSAAAVTAIDALNDPNLSQFKFYLPQDVAVDNSPESDFFGRVYVANPGTGSGYVAAGISVYDQELNKLGDGYKATGHTISARTDIHRLAVQPQTGKIYYAKTGSSTAIYELIPNKNGSLSDGGSSVNVISGVSEIKNANSLCFDENGLLWILNYANYVDNKTTGVIYSVDNKAATLFTKNDPNVYKWVSNDNAIAPDGLGGFWVAQYRSNFDGFYVLSHVNKEGVLDFYINNTTNNTLIPTSGSSGSINASYRGHLAYYSKENMLAFGGADRVSLFTVKYDSDGKPTLTKFGETPSIRHTNSNKNIDGIAFDYAGNLYMASATREKLFIYTLPTNNNTCEVPAKKADVVTKVEPTVALYTITTNVNDPTMGSVSGNLGTYEDGASAELTAVANEHYEFTGWTGDVTSTENPLTITVNSDMTITANFQEQTKYIITASAADNTMGYVTGGGTYYVGETVTLTAVAKSTYYFVNWSDGNTNATRTFPASANLTLTANFAKANPRAWAYDLKMVEEGDNYKFSFTATTAATATLLFLDKEGNELYLAHDIGAVAAGANTVSIEKAYFTSLKDVYWSVKMDGEAIPAISEITDQSRGIYDFYNMMGVVVDNDPNSEMFGDIYVQMSLGGTTNGKTQTPGLFLFNQDLDVLNDNPNVGIQPALPAGYTLTGNRNKFHRLNINPLTGDLVYCYNIADQPAVFAIGRNNMTGEVTNLLSGVTGLYRSGAHCFDENGTLYVIDIYPYSNTQYPGGWYSMGVIYKIVDGIATELVRSNKFANESVTMTADGRSGIWIAQNRANGIDTYYQLAHITDEGIIDWAVNKDTPQGFTGSSSRGALAYDSERQILAQGRNGKVELYTVSYEPTITVTPLHTIADANIGNNIDGLAFDFAGDLYVVNSSKEKFQKFTLPTADNICTVPAPKSQAIVKEIRHTVTTNTIGNGTVIGAGEYVAGETATLTASPAAHHQFVNWTFADVTTSTDNPLTLVVNSDITVTAHFEPIQYTVVALTNDESKGTVTGAGTYDYGTEATLTATPEPGYKLLYWSDRSTENPRNITMTKNAALSAYFVKNYVVEPTFTIEKVWENTNVPGSAAGYQAVGWDGKIYMQNKTEGKIKVYNNGTDAAVDYAASNTSGQQIAVDEAGNLIVFNAYFATATPSAIQIYKNGSTTGTAVSFTLPNPGRCDFISASGDIYSQDGGYVYFYCDTHKLVNRVKITNGELASVDAIGNTANPATSVSHVMVDIFGYLAAHCRSTAVYAINSYTGETTAFNTSLSGIKLSTLGGCSFELGGKEFWAYNVGNTHYNSEWNLYNMTDKVFMSNETLYAKDKVSKKNTGPANWLNVQVVDENTAYIYQFCPEVAVAVWKVTMHEVVLRDTENNEDLLIDLNGSTTNVSVYRSLTGGMYNTLCLPFDVNDLTGTPLENATVWQYNGATVKGDGTSKEIFLDFAEVTSITAGKPYLVEPTEDITAPMEFKNVTISVTNGNNVAQGAVTMHGILHPTELQANNKSILFLVENNNLAWANETANMNGMRAYFKVNEPSLLSARTRAYIRREPTVATDMENITTPETEIKKVIYNGTLYIIRGDEVYTIQGTKVK